MIRRTSLQGPHSSEGVHLEGGGSGVSPSDRIIVFLLTLGLAARQIRLLGRRCFIDFSEHASVGKNPAVERSASSSFTACARLRCHDHVNPVVRLVLLHKPRQRKVVESAHDLAEIVDVGTSCCLTTAHRKCQTSKFLFGDFALEDEVLRRRAKSWQTCNALEILSKVDSFLERDDITR